MLKDSFLAPNPDILHCEPWPRLSIFLFCDAWAGTKAPWSVGYLIAFRWFNQANDIRFACLWLRDAYAIPSKKTR